MKKDNTQWLDILKEKVNSYEGEKPAASWEDMRARMLAAGGSVTDSPDSQKDNIFTASRLHNTRRWWAAAAACLAALVAGGILLNHKQDAVIPAESIAGAEEKIEVVTDGQAAAPSDLLAEAGEETARAAGAHSDAGKAMSAAASSQATGNTPVEISSDAVPGQSDAAETLGSEDSGQEMTAEDKADTAADDAAGNQQGKTDAVQNASTPRQTSQYAFAEPQKKHSSGRFSVGVNGQFGNGDANNNNMAYSYTQHGPAGYSKDSPYGSMTFAMAVARTEYHYAAPISFGVSFRYDMPSGIYAESGLRFTQYLTTVTPSGAKQALLYAGVPVGLGYNLFSTDNIGVYASGYYMPAKCIAGRESTNYPTNSTNRDDIPLQHSAGISAGADYTVWNMISIYAEPTLSYYFKSENAPVTIFTENPFYFTLNVGARFNF